MATFSPSTPTSQYISPGLSQPDYVRSDDPIDDEVDYEYVPVSQRRTVFKDKQEKQPQSEFSFQLSTTLLFHFSYENLCEY